MNEPHGNHISKTYNRYTKIEGKEHKHVTKANHKAIKEETKRRKEQRTTSITRKQVTKGIEYMPTNNQFNYKWTKCTNHKI